MERQSGDGERWRSATARPEDASAAWPMLRIAAPLLVFLTALLLRVLHVVDLRRAPFFDLLMGDSASYDTWAQRIAAGDWMGQEVFYQAPLYPYLLAGLYALAGRDLLLLRLVQAVLGATACLLVALAGRRLFGEWAGLAAGLSLALFAPAIFFDGLVQKASLDGFLVAALVCLLAGVGAARGPLGTFVTGLVLGLLALNRENALLLVPVVGLAVALRPPSRGSRGRVLAAFVAGATIVLAPVALRNWMVGGTPYLTTSQLGPNFYIGNHAGAEGSYEPLLPGRGDPFYERLDATLLAERALGRTLRPAEVSAYWRDRALAWIVAEPTEWLRLLARKTLLAINAEEAMDTEDLATHAVWSFPLRLAAPIAHFGVLAPLGVLGLWLTWGRRRELWPFHALLAVYLAGVVLFYVLARYRFPMVPLLALFAGAAIAQLSRGARRLRPRQIAAAVAVLALTAVACNWPLLSAAGMSARTRINIAQVLAGRGRVAEAVIEYRRALEVDPENASAHAGLAGTYAAQGDRGAAIRHFSQAVELEPSHAAWHEGLGIALAALGRIEQALTAFRRAAEVDPESASARFNLGTALAASGDASGALSAMEAAVRLDPGHARAHNNLGILLCDAGRCGEGIRHFEEALRLRPGFEEAAANLSRAAALTGARENARGSD